MTGCTVKELCAAVGGTLLQQSGAVVTQVSTCLLYTSRCV